MFLCSIITKPRLIEFCISELLSLSKSFGISPSSLFSSYALDIHSELDYCDYFTKQLEINPYIYVTLPSVDICKGIASRSICIERFTKHISFGTNLSELVNDTMTQYQTSPAAQEIISENSTFAFRFDTYVHKVSQEGKQEIIKAFSHVPFAGTVDLLNPTRVFIVSICAEKYYFGLEVAKSKIKRCSFHNKYNLPQREYLGPTTTDIELALLMANQGQVSENSVVLDPFVGTGGILLAASHFGAICYGGDIDMRVLKGLGVGRSTKNTQADIFTNFKNYGFKKPEIFRCDNSVPCLRNIGFFDAVICDPPYGVRAASRKSTKNTTEVYDSKKVFEDLLEFGSCMLRTGGRLVFLLPTERAEYDKNALPAHPLLKLVGNSENVLTRKVSRRLITMEKLDKATEGSEEAGKVFYQDIRNTWFRKG